MPRDGEVEGGAVSDGRFDPDFSSVPLNNTLADCQSDSGATVFLVAVKSFEYAKDFLLVLGVDPDPVVLH
jgi:hypothetical protein